MPLLLEIVTPERIAYSGPVDSVVLPSESGEVGILSGHIPLLTMVEPGELQVTANGATEFLAIDKGFVQVLGDKVSVLTEQAINVSEIDLNALEDARKRAEKALEEAKKQGADSALIEESEKILRFAMAQNLVKGKRR